MLRIILKVASVYQIVAFVVLLLVDINLVVLMIENDLPMAGTQRAMALLNLAMNLSLAKFYWDSDAVLTSREQFKEDQMKFKIWGFSSIVLCGLNQMSELIDERTQVQIPSLEGVDVDLWLRIQYTLYSWKPFINKIVYFISSTPNLFLICLLYVIISRDFSKSENKNR